MPDVWKSWNGSMKSVVKSDHILINNLQDHPRDEFVMNISLKNVTIFISQIVK